MGKLSFGAYRLDKQKGRLYHNGQPLELEPQVFCILELLITRHGEIVSRDEIIDKVWDGRQMSNNVIDNRIRAARAAIGDTGKRQRYIKTYPNRGYKFIGRVSETTSSKTENLQKSGFFEAQSSKPTPSGFWGAVVKLAGVAVSGLLGVYMISQSTNSLDKKASVSAEAVVDEETYKLVTPESNNALPRVAVLPFETVGDSKTYGLLPEVFETRFSQTITSIDGITVVLLSSGAEVKNDPWNYKTLKNEFNLDYVLASNMSSYGEALKLDVSLIRIEDGATLSNETYDLKISSEDSLKDLPESIASKVTLMTANQLNLSLESLPTSWENYDFFLKVQEGETLSMQGDYESRKKSAEIFREAIELEPNYVQAYGKLISTLSWQFQFFFDDNNALLKEQAELFLKMKEISPEAPETLILNSFMGKVEGGIGRDSMGEYIEDDPLSVINYVLKKDPDNQNASQTLAYLSSREADQAETVKAFEKLIRLNPTDAWSVPNYSLALFCNRDFGKARLVLDRARQWHPDGRFLVLVEITQAQAIGDYETALLKVKNLLEGDFIYHDETKSVSSLFFDLGYPELALPHIRFAPMKARVYAMMGDKEAALKSANVIESYYQSVHARLVADESYVPENYRVDRVYRQVGSSGDTTKANACRLDHLVRDSHFLKKTGSEKFDSFLLLLTDYFEGKDAEALKTREEYTTLMGLYVLQGEVDKAIEVMDIAMDKGFLFIGSFKEPYLRELTSHPGFAERLERMQKSADLLIEKYYLN